MNSPGHNEEFDIRHFETVPQRNAATDGELNYL
jgi:hypothetical protein